MSVICPEFIKGNVITSRVRLARNVNGLPFRVNDKKVANEIVKNVNRALVKCDSFNLYYLSNLSGLETEAMKENYLISQTLIDNGEFGAVLVSNDKKLSVMINEEDVIRAQCFTTGLNLLEPYKRINTVDDELCKNLPIAYDEEFGFLTACPTNLGTGLRASVLMFLPALTESGKIGNLIEEASELGMTVRGAFGEGSTADGYLYQISNEITLGLSEYEIIEMVSDKVERICQVEREEAAKLFFGRNEIKTIDSVKRAYGILTNAVLLSYDEFLEKIAKVKLGAMLGMIDINDLEGIDKLIIRVRPANLCAEYGKRLSAADRDLFRAEVVKNQLLKLKG